MSLERDLRQVLAQLELISHVSAAQPGGQGHDESEDIGGRRPPGGIDHRDDKPFVKGEPNLMLQRSPDHFRRRLAKAHNEQSRREILHDAQKSLEAWKRQPAPTDPEWGSFQWRRQIVAEIRAGKRTIDGARQFYSISRATVYRYLSQFIDERKSA